MNDTYPDLMAGKKILYVHGFMSAGSTHTAELLRQFMPQATVVAPDLPVVPTEAMELLRRTVETEKPDLIIGTSMGGMYTEMLRGVDRILVNPAFQMGQTMKEHNMMGKQTFQNPRKDGVQEFIVTKALVKEYREMTEQCFTGMTDDDRQRVYGLFGDNDPVVHTFDLFSSHYPNAIHFHGEHRLVERVVHHYLIPVIRWIDDKQEQRERPTIIIDRNTLSDCYGHPRSSVVKAYEALIDRYNVFFLCPAPTENADAMAADSHWIADTFSAPAWNHVVYANQLQLVVGDYLISSESADDFIGTSLQLGSDEFKTWDEVTTFFDRLGGQ